MIPDVGVYVNMDGTRYLYKANRRICKGYHDTYKQVLEIYWAWAREKAPRFRHRWLSVSQFERRKMVHTQPV